MSNLSSLNIADSMSFACTTPMKSSNSPDAIGNIDLLLSIIFTLLMSLSSSKSIHMISLRGVMILSTFWSSSLKTLLMMSSSSCSIVPSSLPSLIINSISSSVTTSSFLFSILSTHKRKLLDFARMKLTGFETFSRMTMLFATFRDILSGSFNAITLGTISPTTNVKYVVTITTIATLIGSL